MFGGLVASRCAVQTDGIQPHLDLVASCHIATGRTFPGDRRMRKYVAFDIETAFFSDDPSCDWRTCRPLGITCAAALTSDGESPTVWHGKHAETGSPTDKMTPAEAAEIVCQLCQLVEAGYTLLTWNGMGFDLDILSEEASEHERCCELARNHVDMMYHVHCELGYPVSLVKCAQAFGIKGKLDGLSSEDAPRLWKQGQWSKVIEYICQDVRLALQVATACEAARQFRWITQKGQRRNFVLNRGWLLAHEASRLPLPDTSWMDNPRPRSAYTAWMTARR